MKLVDSNKCENTFKVFEDDVDKTLLDEVIAEKDSILYNDIQRLRMHFLEVLPEGYSSEQIKQMSDEEIMNLASIYDNHCF